jgi:RNA polymerase sigma-70 factor (ECF subfamily)
MSRATERRVTKSADVHPDTREPRIASSGQSEYAALVTEAARGNRQALESLLMRAQEVAYRFSLTVCGHAEDAEDVMQDALVKTYRYVSRIRHPEAFKPWLYRTVRNACLMRRRKRVHEPARLQSLDELLPTPDGLRPLEVPDGRRDPEALVLNQGLRRRLRRALQGLPPAFRTILFLREMEGLSTREVAQVTGLSEANVKTRLHRARLHLQKHLGDVR